MATSLQTNIDRLIHDFKEFYSKTVRNNPETVTQIESAVRIVSFLVAGRFENGDLISELIFSASNLLVFLNDNVFKAASKVIQIVDVSKERLQRWLTVLEYTEVFLEMASRKKWGDYGAWVVITVVQITKTVMRFVLLMKLNAGIQTMPHISPVDREVLKAAEEEHDSLEDAWDEETANSAPENTFTLKSSGRQIRTLKAAQGNGFRTWGVPNTETSDPTSKAVRNKRKLINQPSSRLTKHRWWGELLHIARPMAHLFVIGMYMCGQNSWKPWLLACGMDVSSNALMSGPENDLNSREKSELRRRKLMLLYFLMRSPFYNKYTKEKIFAVLHFVAAHVPLSGFITRPVLEYLPNWQKMYFYVWNT